ncbi:MAG TPA: lipopolysaccharide heptosyltransferase II [Chitinophagaceae bacterium]|nr:lipopolysaccharide heptosyltransferase II [Chitinophagaceae bacterium]
MKILVRLPNWLGDTVMAVGFVQALQQQYPVAHISVITKKGLAELMNHIAPLQHVFIFSKEDYKGLAGLWRFGKKIKKDENFDLFFCLPDSFSSAFMGWATGIKKRIGFKNDLRNLLLTHACKKPKGLHRVNEYLSLLNFYTGTTISQKKVLLKHQYVKDSYIVVNINSEASSRRLTKAKAIEILTALQKATEQKIILIGAPKEKEFVDTVIDSIPEKKNIQNFAGETSLSELVKILASAQAMLSTDSGPAHLANALNTFTVVLFGAGNEKNTAPYNSENRQIIRLGQLSCEPCEKNVCVRYGIPQCLERLDTQKIVSAIFSQHDRR